MADASGEPLRQLQSPFLSLPAELVIEVIGQLSAHNRDLCSLARACRLVKPICEKFIYSQIQLRDTAELKAICDAFGAQHQRAKAVRTLNIVYKHNRNLANTVEDRNRFNRYVKLMTNLRTWHIESPFDNGDWHAPGSTEWVERDMQIFRQALELSCLRQGQPPHDNVGLAKLQKLTIHSHGIRTDYWNLGNYQCLFRHPSLRYLHISCVKFPADLPELEPFACTTPLTTIIFDECELETGSLRRILQTPKYLKNLTLGENVHNATQRGGLVPRLTPSAAASLRALMPVAHSLEALTHIDPTFGTLSDPTNPPAMRLKGGGMRDFHHLKRLECDPCSFLHQGIMLHPNLAPPNLETLALRRYSKQPEDFFDDLPKVTPYTYLPSLKQLEFIQPMVIRYPQDHRRHANYICHPDRLRERHASAYQLWKCGVNMKILAEMQRRASWIPPYLHGEIPPEPIVVYDAAKVGFLRFIDDDRETEPAPAPTGGFQTATGSVALPPQRIANKDRKFFEESPKETDKLTKADIERLHGQVGRLLTAYCSAQGMGSGPPMVAYYGGPGWELTDNIAGPNFGGLGVVVATGTMYDLDSDMSDDDDDWMVPDAVFANLSQASAGEGSDDASQDHNAIGNDAQADDIGDDEHDDENDDDLEDSEDDSGDDSDSTMGDSGDSNVDDIDAALDEIIDAVHDEFHAAAGDYIGDVLADASGDHIMDVD